MLETYKAADGYYYVTGYPEYCIMHEGSIWQIYRYGIPWRISPTLKYAKQFIEDYIRRTEKNDKYDS